MCERQSAHLFTKERFQQKWSQNTLWENEHRYTDTHKKEQKWWIHVRKALSLTSNQQNVTNTKWHSHPMYWQRVFKMLMGSFTETWMGPESAIKSEVTGSSTLFWDSLEGWAGEGEGRGVQWGGRVSTSGGFMMMRGRDHHSTAEPLSATSCVLFYTIFDNYFLNVKKSEVREKETNNYQFSAVE